MGKEHSKVTNNHIEANTAWSPLSNDIWKIVFVNESISISIKIWVQFVPYGPFIHELSLVQLMPWRRTDDKRSSELMMALVTDANMSHPASINFQRNFCPKLNWLN